MHTHPYPNGGYREQKKSRQGVIWDRKCTGRIVIIMMIVKMIEKWGRGGAERLEKGHEEPLCHPSVPLIQFLVPHSLSTHFTF